MNNIYLDQHEEPLLKKLKDGFIYNIKKYWPFYMIMLPVVVYFVIFQFIPIYGVQLAFKKYSFKYGISGSKWIGLENFKSLFTTDQFFDRAVKNTLILSLMNLLLGFPCGLVLALLINEVSGKFVKLTKKLQIIYTFPHFLSWVILSGIIFNIFSGSGVVNNVLLSMGFEKQKILYNASVFRYLVIYSGVWKEVGWATIVYLAAMAKIDPSLYEAATVDGANRFHRLIHITWPGIKFVFITLLILRVGNMMNDSFDQIYNLYSQPVYSTVDTLSTYVFRRTFQQGMPFGMSTAVTVFKGAVNMILLIFANIVVKAMGEQGI